MQIIALMKNIFWCSTRNCYFTKRYIYPSLISGLSNVASYHANKLSAFKMDEHKQLAIVALRLFFNQKFALPRKVSRNRKYSKITMRQRESHLICSPISLSNKTDYRCYIACLALGM